jgi:D-sedoheptulose 7-phosphate isomerase
MKYAYDIGAVICSIVGRNDGYAYQHSNNLILIPSPKKELLTAYAESFQSVVLHLLASHPSLKENKTKWESVDEPSSISG